jgi:hypothetical protein
MRYQGILNKHPKINSTDHESTIYLITDPFEIFIIRV